MAIAYNETEFKAELDNYYGFLYKEILNNKIFRQHLTGADYISSNLFFTGEEVVRIILELKYGYRYEPNYRGFKGQILAKHGVEFIKAVEITGGDFYNRFVDELIKSNIIIINAKEHISNANRYLYPYREEESLTHFKEKVKTIREIRDNTKDKMIKDVLNYGIQKMYGASLRNISKSMVKNEKSQEFYDNGLELYNEMSEFLDTCDTFLITNGLFKDFLSKVKDQEDAKKITKLMKKLELVSLGVMTSQKIIITCLKEIAQTKSEIKNENLVVDLVELLKRVALSSLYTNNSKEKNENQTEITNILLPLMGKQRESGLTLLKGPIKRDLEIENKLEIESGDKININFILELKKNHKVLKRLIDYSLSQYVTGKEGDVEAKIKITKITKNLANISLLVDKDTVKNLSEETLFNLREKIIDSMYGEINKYMIDVEEGNSFISDNIIKFLKAIPNIFFKEVRASQIQNEFNNIDKEKVIVNKKKI